MNSSASTRSSTDCTQDRPECDFPTCAVACVCSCSLENPQSKACGKNLGKTWVKFRFCAIFKQKHWKKPRIFILSWLWAQKNLCHSRTKCKFSIFLSILLGVFEAQVTVDRSRAVILRTPEKKWQIMAWWTEGVRKVWFQHCSLLTQGQELRRPKH